MFRHDVSVPFSQTIFGPANQLKEKHMKSRKIQFLFQTLALVFCFSCETVWQPKERGYDRFDLPEPKYRIYDAGHPFVFEVSESARACPDSSRLTEPHWVNIKYPFLNAEVRLTYKPLDQDLKKLNQHIEDARKLVNKHNVKAYGIEETKIKNASGQTAIVFGLTGQVPTQFQFYTTDSSRHFLRGALYFQTATENDSLAPAIEYISRDMLHMLKTLKWKDDQ
jgi:gliding motility-associated lipoprotein GldD